MSTTSKSFRLPTTDVNWLKMHAKHSGITQTDIISQALIDYKNRKGLSISNIETSKAVSLAEGGVISATNTDDDMIAMLGISSIAGFTGYHLAGYIRKQLDMDEDKGMQMLIGLLGGLGTALLMDLNRK